MMENFGILCGVTLGLFGSVFSVVQFFYQRHKDKAEAEREAAREKAQAEREAAREKMHAEREAARDKAQAEREDFKDRIAFLMQVIFDKDIPRESRQPFFDEYIQKGGNGTVIKFWLEKK